MKNLKGKIKSALTEANYMVKPEDVDRVMDKLDKDDVVKIVDEGEGEENNPWAICTASVGREDKEKYEACVKKVKKETGYIEEEVSENAKMTKAELIGLVTENKKKIKVKRIK